MDDSTRFLRGDRSGPEWPRPTLYGFLDRLNLGRRQCQQEKLAYREYRALCHTAGSGGTRASIQGVNIRPTGGAASLETTGAEAMAPAR